MTATTRTFPLDGFADTCVGYGNAADGGCEQHGTDDDIWATGDGLCRGCSARLRREIRLAEEAKRPTYPNDCPYGGCKDHTHGGRYYDCLCCYGD